MENTQTNNWSLRQIKQTLIKKAFEAAPVGLRRSLMLDNLLREDTSEVHTFYAKTEAEHEAAFRLIHDCYVRAGYMYASPTGMRVRAHDLLPETATILAVHNGQACGTISVVNDSALKLPIDQSFGAEIDAIRAQGRKVAEVTGLAIASHYRGGGLMLAMTRFMMAHALRTGVDSLIVGVSPGHAAFYRDVLMFKELGPARSYSSKIEDIVVGMVLDLRTAREALRKAYRGAPGRLNLFEFYCGKHDVLNIRDQAYGSNEEGGKAVDFLDYFLYGPGRLCDEATPEEIAYIQEANHTHLPRLN